MNYQIKIPSCIYGGEGSIKNVTSVIEQESVKKAVVFTDKGIKNTGLLDILLEVLKQAHTEYEVF